MRGRLSRSRPLAQLLGLDRARSVYLGRVDAPLDCSAGLPEVFLRLRSLHIIQRTVNTKLWPGCQSNLASVHPARSPPALCFQQHVRGFHSNIFPARCRPGPTVLHLTRAAPGSAQRLSSALCDLRNPPPHTHNDFNLGRAATLLLLTALGRRSRRQDITVSTLEPGSQHHRAERPSLPGRATVRIGRTIGMGRTGAR